MARAPRKDEDDDVAELDRLRPYLELAREIHDEVARLAADPSQHGDLVGELIDRVPHDERMKLAQAIFDQLSTERQWEVLERVFGDEELREHLAADRADSLAAVHRDEAGGELRRRARQRGELDTRDVPTGMQLVVGLFREHDVRPAITRGHTSSTCARKLVLRALGDGRFQVIEDTFNPNGGYFVTGDYSEDTWRAEERLDGHVVVRIGSIVEHEAGPTFEPVLYPGGRLDADVGGRAAPGRLHLGFAMLGDLDVFAG